MTKETKKNDEVGQEEIAAKLPFGSFHVKGVDIVGIGTFVVVGIIAYALWNHKDEARDIGANFSAAVKEMTAAQVQMVQAQREQNCLLIYPQDKREAAYETCKRVSR